jgi:hypothetical protein
MVSQRIACGTLMRSISEGGRPIRTSARINPST